MVTNWDDTLLNSMRKSTDTFADEVIRTLSEEGRLDQFGALMKLEHNADTLPPMHPLLQDLVERCHRLPDWADPEKIERAEQFFQEYQVYVYSALLFASLPYCYAAADGARVLAASNRIRENTGKRLSETGQFIMDVSEKGSFLPGGKAFKSIAKVRLIHAAVRHRLLNSGDWDKNWGQPTNMEDMAGTNLAFSLVVLKAMERMGAEADSLTKDAFIHKWNIISYLLGLDQTLLAKNYEEALKLEKQIIRRLFRKSEEGQILNRALLEFIHEVERPLAPDYGSQMIRYLLGNQVGDLLGLKELSLFNWPSVLSSLNGLVAGMGWSPKEKDMYIPLHLALIKRGQVVNQRMDYPLQDILNPDKHT